jgi:two-component system, LytTR family, response regulator
MEEIKAIIIDDELHCINTLSRQLEKYCPQIKLLTRCESAAAGMSAIANLQPDLVFLDIEMPRMNGFEMLQHMPKINFEVIFTTAYDQFAIKAIRFSALDYLLKPIDKDELIGAVEKVHSRKDHFLSSQQLDLLLSNLYNQKNGLQKIALPTLEGYELVLAAQIVRCESDGNYTMVYFKNGQKLLVSKTLKDIEELLAGHHFFRVHHSHLINLNEINRYIKGDGGYVVMSDNANVNVARSKKDALLKFF